jgi:predicted glycoside hydrolase/deacetylase ChbG (UPF0249 family)
LQRVTFTADDFGLTQSVNEAVERAHRAGKLHAASLMVAGPPRPMPFAARTPCRACMSGCISW